MIAPYKDDHNAALESSEPKTEIDAVAHAICTSFLIKHLCYDICTCSLSLSLLLSLYLCLSVVHSLSMCTYSLL